MMGYCYGWGSYASELGGYWWVIPTLFWGLIITGIIFLVRVNWKGSSYKAIEALEYEYALGRISREEFLSKKRDLQ